MNEITEDFLMRRTIKKLRPVADGTKAVEKWSGPWKLVYRQGSKVTVELPNATFAMCRSKKKKCEKSGQYKNGTLAIIPDRK